jgi:hypothetical protein
MAKNRKRGCPYCPILYRTEYELAEHIAKAHPVAVENGDIRDLASISISQALMIERIYFDNRKEDKDGFRKEKNKAGEVPTKKT